jgi:hypothetical protein
MISPAGWLTAFLFVAMTGIAQTSTQILSFPADFSGKWKGTLHWYPSQKPVQQVLMQLSIQPSSMTGCYDWQLTYGDKGQDLRPYLLKPVDTIIGRWVIDENNGILLDGYWRGERFICTFSVQGSMITSAYWLENGALQVEMITHRTEAIRESGGGDQNTPAVKAFPLLGYQRAALYRVKQ